MVDISDEATTKETTTKETTTEADASATADTTGGEEVKASGFISDAIEEI